KSFSGDMLDIIEEPQLEFGEKELVQITHDECHFYANDGMRKIWIKKNGSFLRPKHAGRSIMVSAFLCSCYGVLQLSDEQMKENPHIKYKEAFILCSIQSDGYWKSEHMLEQLVQRAIPIFEVLHLNCVGIFCFDQSTNHNAIAENALVVTKMNLDDYEVVKLRGQPKGIRQVLIERKLWPSQGVCLQRDFCEQKSMLEEVVLERGHIFERYPKFHYKKTSYVDLQQQVPQALVNIPMSTIHKFARKSWRYMDAYEKGLDGRTAEWAVNKYKSHRRLPENIERAMDSNDK
ncbi:788_t:CDS:2, partial [Dentiscutata heterogama]